MSQLPDTPEIVSQNARLYNKDCADPRFKFLIDTLVRHLHDYVRETKYICAVNITN